jgi:long-chain acyl-CoA synthetase
LTHHNLIANASGLTQVHPIHSSDEFLSVLPMYHAFEFTGGLLVPLASGATITYVKELKGPEILAAMQATGTTIMLVVPRLLRSFLDAIEGNIAAASWLTRTALRTMRIASRATGDRYARRLFGKVHRRFGGRLRMLVSGGSHLDRNLWEAFTQMGFTVHEGYGLTETSPVLTVTPTNGARPGSVGPPLPNVSLEIRNPNQEGVGEIWVRGPSVMAGYLENPEANAEAIRDGWFKTGDLGREDGEGYIALTGRTKDLIVTSAGKNVYPDEVELRYADLPYVKELCVFGMNSNRGLGDAVHAVIVLDRDSAPGLDRSSIEREIRTAVEAASPDVPVHQRITCLHFWERELPKTSTLKAQRRLIREMITTLAPSEQRGDVAGEDRSDPLADQPRSPHGAGSGKSRASRSRDASPDSAKASGGSTPWNEAPYANGQTHPETLAAVQQILAKPSGKPAGSIAPEMHLLLDLGIDSIGKIDIIGNVESRFGIMLDDNTGAQIARVDDILAAIGDRAPRGGAGGHRRNRGNGAYWKRRFTGDGVQTLEQMEVPSGLLSTRWMVRGASGAMMRSYVRVRATGLENIPSGGAFILTPNHTSHLDALSIMTALRGRRRVWVAAAEDYFFRSALRRYFFGRLFNAVPFDRNADGVEGLRRCGRVLDSGDGLLLFPEGTRSRTGRMQSFKTGAAVLAVEKGVPLIPVHIHRSFQLLRKGQVIPRPGTITVTFGQPRQSPPLDDDESHFDTFQKLTRQVEADVRSMGDRMCAE